MITIEFTDGGLGFLVVDMTGPVGEIMPTYNGVLDFVQGRSEAGPVVEVPLPNGAQAKVQLTGIRSTEIDRPRKSGTFLFTYRAA